MILNVFVSRAYFEYIYEVFTENWHKFNEAFPLTYMDSLAFTVAFCNYYYLFGAARIDQGCF